jgi:hypothetical protein
MSFLRAVFRLPRYVRSLGAALLGGGGIGFGGEHVDCISHCVLYEFGCQFLRCFLCIVSSGLRVEMAPKFTFVFGPQWSYIGPVGEESL